jgi:hypothetical protein
MAARAARNHEKAATATPRKKAMVVDAFVLHEPLLDAHLAAKNIIDFFGECIEELAGDSDAPAKTAGFALRCREKMDAHCKAHGAAFRPAVSEILREFGMEYDALRPSLVSASSATETLSTALKTAFEAKAYKVRYLSAILGNEISALNRSR